MNYSFIKIFYINYDIAKINSIYFVPMNSQCIRVLFTYPLTHSILRETRELGHIIITVSYPLPRHTECNFVTHQSILPS